MNAALELLTEARAAGLALEVSGDRLRYRAPAPPPPSLLDKLREHKAELLRILAGNVDADLPARARQRVRDACERHGIDAAPVLIQFDRWAYNAADLRELLAWPDETLQAHVELLVRELCDGVTP